MGILSRSSSSTTTNLSVDSSTDILDQSGNNGVLGSGNTVITTVSDNGATEASRAVSIEALRSGAEGVSQLGDFFGRGADRLFDSADKFGTLTRDAYRDSLGFADKSQDRAFDSVGMVARTLEASADSSRRSVADAFKTAQDSATGNRTLMFVALAVVGVVGVAVFARKAA
jgi:hypothetical protein